MMDENAEFSSLEKGLIDKYTEHCYLSINIFEWNWCIDGIANDARKNKNALATNQNKQLNELKTRDISIPVQKRILRSNCDVKAEEPKTIASNRKRKRNWTNRIKKCNRRKNVSKNMLDSSLHAKNSLLQTIEKTMLPEDIADIKQVSEVTGMVSESTNDVSIGQEKTSEKQNSAQNSTDNDVIPFLESFNILKNNVMPQYEQRLIYRKISHKWRENNGKIKTYRGMILSLDTKGICSIVYAGSLEIYHLTIHELYEDFRLGDLNFL